MQLHAAQNPFRAQRFHALAYRADNLEWGALMQRLWAQGGRGAIVGPHGHGKTTLMDALGKQLEAAGMDCLRLNLRRECRNLPGGFHTGIHAGSVVLVDGAEQLGALAWRRLLLRARHAKGVVITTHRPGRLPTLHTCRTSETLLNELLRELAPEEAHHLYPRARELFAVHRGNLREVWFALYEHCAHGNA